MCACASLSLFCGQAMYSCLLHLLMWLHAATRAARICREVQLRNWDHLSCVSLSDCRGQKLLSFRAHGQLVCGWGTWRLALLLGACRPQRGRGKRGASTLNAALPLPPHNLTELSTRTACLYAAATLLADNPCNKKMIRVSNTDDM